MDKFERLFNQLPAEIECALITSDVNRRYFTGMKSSAGTVIAFRNGNAYLIIDFRYIEKARAAVKNAVVIEQKKLLDQLKELIKENSADNISIEAQTMTVSSLKLYKKNFPELEINDTDMLSNAINSLRMIKNDYEIECIQKAQDIAEAAFDEITKLIRPGITEREIAAELDRRMLMNGAEAISFDTIVLSGTNTSMPHGVPSDKKIEDDELVLLDFGAVYNGYHSDMTRTVCVGEPDDEMKKVYNTVLKAQSACLEKAHGGMTGKELDYAARKIISDAGYGSFFGHSLGHGVGMEIHEMPNASPNNEKYLPVGSVVTIEPGIYLPGKFGVRIEDFVILTENGCVNMTKCAKNILSL